MTFHPGAGRGDVRVDPRTVARWASSGRIGLDPPAVGHRRCRESEIRALLAELTVPAGVADVVVALSVA
jgi:hypothetical protein